MAHAFRRQLIIPASKNPRVNDMPLQKRLTFGGAYQYRHALILSNMMTFRCLSYFYNNYQRDSVVYHHVLQNRAYHQFGRIAYHQTARGFMHACA